MKAALLGLTLVATLALPATHALAQMCGGGPIDTPDAMAAHVVVDLAYSANSPEALSFVEQQFDPALSASMPAPALTSSWQAYQAPRGDFKMIGEMSDSTQGGLTVVKVPVQFANGAGVVLVSVHPDLTVAAITLLPADS